MFSCIKSGALQGLESHLIEVEVDVSTGLPSFQMVGFLSSEVKESKDRVKVALRNSGFLIPPMCINVNLSPAAIHKAGTAYDLPIAIGILCSLGDISPESVSNTLIIGELGLNGEVRKVSGILPIVQMARQNNISRIILPLDNLNEASLVPDISAYGASSLIEVYEYLTDNTELIKGNYIDPQSFLTSQNKLPKLFEDIQGQTTAKRASMVAAAGFHNMLMIGPPGSGKTMLAKCIPGILPPLSINEALEVTSIYSIAGLLDDKVSLITHRPFMAPHHSITLQALCGGGKTPTPGIISLAHRGVLFLDEMTEYNRATLDLLRQPLEEKCIHITRLQGNYRYPTDFMLIAACNPCPCGYYPDFNKCSCTKPQVDRYLGRISGPLLDRIDICCDVDHVDLCKPGNLTADPTYTTAEMLKKVEIARKRQTERFKNSPFSFNSEMTGREVTTYCLLSTAGQRLIESTNERYQLSARSYHRILKLARTVADLDDSETIREEHLAEAIFYRTSGSRYWGR